MVKQYRLHGHFQGQTVNLGGFQFVKGVLTANYPTKEEHETLAAFLAQWQAKEVVNDGQCSLPEVRTQKLEGEVEPKGDRPPSGGESDDGKRAASPSPEPTRQLLGSEGNGQTESVKPEEQEDIRFTRLRNVVQGLDPKVDTNWTQAGKPALPAIEKALGTSGITRALVESVCPGYKRPL